MALRNLIIIFVLDYLFSILNYSVTFLKKIYYKYSKNFNTLTSGDEPVINYEFQKNVKLKWLDYKYQAIWVYEMANKYPFYIIKNLERKIYNLLVLPLHY